jgi:hypothetical protein
MDDWLHFEKFFLSIEFGPIFLYFHAYHLKLTSGNIL